MTAALLVGNQSAIARDDWQVYRDTGVAHLMGYPGLHITPFAWLATRLVGPACGGWHRCGLAVAALADTGGGCVAAVAGHSVCAAGGLGVPAQRTVFMLATVVLRRHGLDCRGPWCGCGAWRWCWAADLWAGLQPGFCSALWR